MKKPAILLTLLFAAASLSAQDNPVISQYFEGKQVVVKLDMPGTQQGIDLYPNKPNPFDAKAYGKRIKSFPVSIHNGESVMVTTVKVKDKLIEFQLAGGGFGTFTDDTNTAPQFTPANKSDREKDLEKQLDNTTDSDQRDRIRGELDYLRRQRDRDDQRNRSIAQHAAEIKKVQVDDNRARGGSRFNLKYDGKVPANITPQDVMAALAPYVSFAPEGGGPQQAGAPPPAANGSNYPAPEPPNQSQQAQGLQKGMREEDVRALYGSPTSMADTDHDGLQVHSETFAQGNSLLHADFVNGILVRYSIDVH